MARKMFVWFSMGISVLQVAMGIALLICGCLGIGYTNDQLYTRGPPYSTGAFVAGAPIIGAGIVSCAIFWKAKSIDTSNQNDVKFLGCLIAVEIVLCACSLVGSMIGLGMVAILGLFGDCDPFTDSYDTEHCNYTISTNKLIATWSMGFIVSSVVISFLVLCCNFACKKEFGVSLCRQPRSSSFEYQGTVSTFQADRFPVTGVNQQYVPVLMGGASPNAAAQPREHLHYTKSRVQELEEENRLLHAQIHLQEQQLELQQQLRRREGQSLPSTAPMYTPPPPSYEQCVTEESMLRALEEQNKKLQFQWQLQQQVLEKPFPTQEQAGVEPSAPLEESTLESSGHGGDPVSVSLLMESLM